MTAYGIVGHPRKNIVRTEVELSLNLNTKKWWLQHRWFCLVYFDSKKNGKTKQSNFYLFTKPVVCVLIKSVYRDMKKMIWVLVSLAEEKI